MNSRHVRLALLGSILLVCTTALPALAQYGQASSVDCIIPTTEGGEEDTSIARGGTIVIVADPPPGQRCGTPGAQAVVTLESAPITLAVVTVDSTGGFETAAITIPSDVSTGAHTIRVVTTLDGRSVQYTRAITITRGGAGGLPRTGRQIALLVLWAVMLIGFGSVLVSATWRRWREARVEAAVTLRRGQNPSMSLAAALESEAGGIELDGAPAIELRPASTRAIPVRGETPEVARGDEVDAAMVEVGAVVQKAAAQSSQLLSRLQDEIKAWSKHRV